MESIGTNRISVYSDLQIHVPQGTDIQKHVDHIIAGLMESIKGGSTVINNMTIILDSCRYEGNLTIKNDNVKVMTRKTADNAATIVGSVLVEDVVGVRFVNLIIVHPRNRIAFRIKNPDLNVHDQDLLTEVQCTKCTIHGAVTVSGVGAHLHLHHTHIANTRGLPGLLVDGGGSIVIHDGCSIRNCKLAISASCHSRTLTSYSTSTVHILTNDLVCSDHLGPNLEDDGGKIVSYISVLEQQLFASTIVPGSINVVDIIRIVEEMATTHAIYPSGNPKHWTKEQFVREIQNLKEQIGSQWNSDINRAWGKTLDHIDRLMNLEKNC